MFPANGTELQFNSGELVFRMGDRMKVCIAYMSYYGNGKMVAEEMASLLGDAGHQITMVQVRDGGRNDLPESDLLVVGTPIRMGKIVRKTRKFVKTLNGRRYALYVTHASDIDGNKFTPTEPANDLMTYMESRGNQCVSEPLFIQVQEMKGPLEEGWRQKVADFVSSLN